MANAAPVQLFNTDPNVQAQAALLQQRMALAQALQGEGMHPLDISNRSIGGVAYRVSPLEGLAKMAQAVSGQKLMRDTVGQQAQLAAQAYGNLLDRYKPGDTPQFSPDQINAGEASGMNGDGMGPPDPQKVAAYLQGQTPAQGRVNPNNPTGIPAQILAQHNAGMMDDETFKALTSGYGATDATKAALQGNMDPQAANRAAFSKSQTDSKIWAMQQAGLSPEQIYLAQLGEAAKAGDIERKPDQQFQNPLLGQSGVVPKIPEGANPVGVPAPNGALPGVTPMPGAAPIMQRNAQANSTGSANGSIVFPTTNTGAVVPMRGAQAAPTGQAGMAAAVAGPMGATVAQLDNEIAQTQRGIGTVQDPASKAMLQQHLADMQQQRQSLVANQPPALGQSTAAKVTQENGAKVMTELPVQVQQTKQTITGLENALNQLQQLKKSGPGVSKTVNALGILQNAGLPVMAGDTNGYQSLKKYIENAASSAAASGGFTGSDARFEQFKNGQPNAETMNAPALEGAIRYVLSQQDAALNRGNSILGQAGSDPNKYQGAQQAWSKQYNPRYFEVQRMAPTEQAAAVNNMKPAEAAAFLAWRKAQKGN